jgi:signal transduction histidine kinase
VHQKTLEQNVAAEIFIIAREAIINAFRHAQPSRVTVALHYGRRRFALSVADDGPGFDVQGSSEARGHWGLRGMFERAEKLGASLTCDSMPGVGTTIRLSLKARRAYE